MATYLPGFTVADDRHFPYAAAICWAARNLDQHIGGYAPAKDGRFVISVKLADSGYAFDLAALLAMVRTTDSAVDTAGDLVGEAQMQFAKDGDAAVLFWPGCPIVVDGTA